MGTVRLKTNPLWVQRGLHQHTRWQSPFCGHGRLRSLSPLHNTGELPFVSPVHGSDTR